MTNTDRERARAKRQGQIYARELFNEEHLEILPTWIKITELTDKFESEIDELLEELALDKIAAPASIDDEDSDELRTLEFENTKRHLLEIILRENILGEEINDGLDYQPRHGMVYDLRLEG